MQESFSSHLKLRITNWFIFFIVLFCGLLTILYFSEIKKIGTFYLVPIRVTIPEGYTVEDIAKKFKTFKNFDYQNFINIAKEAEGRLFPDTYFFTGKEDEMEILRKMRENFYNKVGKIDNEILIMASILEKEAKTKEDMEIISGILWKRMELDMPLQVDAVMETYKYKGLPPSPICNPGLKAINAAKNPTPSPYLYYLSDRDSNIHYAKTLTEHNANINKYLRNKK